MAYDQPDASRFPIRPQRPAFLNLDPNSDVFSDTEYFPAEVEVTEALNQNPSGGTNARRLSRETLEAVDIPSSGYSTSRYSRDLSCIGYPFPDVQSVSLADNNSHRSRSLNTFSRARDSLASPPTTPTHTSQYLVSRLRSPLAGPPSYPQSPTETVVGSPSPSGKFFPIKLHKKPYFKSTALLDVDKNPIHKPWIGKKEFLRYVSYWLTWSMILLMVSALALRTLVKLAKIDQVGDLCLVLDDDFENGLDRSTWFHEVDMGGFGNNEFEMTTNSENNSYVEDGILYLVPTLTADNIGKEAVFDGYSYNLTGCTNANLTTCSAVSNSTLKSVIHPIQSARITTKYSHSIQYGRVEIRARLPRGDWLWPALWMLPTDNEYGPWPMSGEIDIMESRGNGLDYPFRGRNYVHTSLNWGPVDFVDAVLKTYGWFTGRRIDFSDDFHTYVLEWSETFMRSYVDTPLRPMYNIKFDKPFFERGKFPLTAFNGSEQVAVTNPWEKNGSNAAPFNKPFYLIMNVAVGGKNGWFPDTLGGKMWLDSSRDAMHDFAKAQKEWYSTWPEDPTRRGMAIDYVKMWQKC